jgi:hypothetical protein
MLQVNEIVSRLRGEASMLVLRYMTEPQLVWLLAWLGNARQAATICGGYPGALAARSACWDEDALTSRLHTGRALEFSVTGCVWDSESDLMGLSIDDACADLASGLADLVHAAPESMALSPAYGFGLVHVSRLTGGGVLLVLD